MSSLFCIIANKGLHDFSVKKVFMLIFFLMGQYCFCIHRVTHIYVLWIHKVHCALFLCGLLIFESYMWLWLVLRVIALPRVIQCPIIVEGTKLWRRRSCSYLWMPYLSSMEVFCGLNRSEVPARETNARYYYLIETIV